jgi:hypothetical protein
MRVVIESDDVVLATAGHGSSAFTTAPAKDGGAAARSGVVPARPRVAVASAVDGGRAPSRRLLERGAQPFRSTQAIDAGPPPAYVTKRTGNPAPKPNAAEKGAPPQKRK